MADLIEMDRQIAEELEQDEVLVKRKKQNSMYLLYFFSHNTKGKLAQDQEDSGKYCLEFLIKKVRNLLLKVLTMIFQQEQNCWG